MNTDSLKRVRRRANSLVTRALRLQDEGKFAEAERLLDEAERIMDEAEAA